MASENRPLDIDLLAAALRADSADVGTFVEGLASKLEDALPGRVRVRRARTGMFGPKLVRKIEVQAADGRLELLRGQGDAVETRRARMSGGIVLKNEPLDTETWLTVLGQALADEAGRNDRTRRALERLLLE